ncbi:hypothetical protein [Acinetobacter portensis]|uniref:hypothetical protein n=1 Tax=Acinetobacter portensis TaxID=1839785 RepID=UPI0013D5377D|nr:hypothetical protein [Acinetobacter portensis]
MIRSIEELTIENLCLDNLSNELSHLSEMELLSLISDYKSDKTVKEILQLYSINTIPSKFKKLLPLIYADFCSHCGGKVVFELQSKTYSYGLLEEQTAQCVQCSHKPNGYSCQCDACVRTENEKRILAEAQKKRVLLSKREAITKEYNPDGYEKIEESELGTTEKIFLSVIVRNCLSEDGKYITPIKNSLLPLTPDNELTTKLIRYLTSRSILIPSIDSEVDAFVFDEDQIPSSYYTYEVKYRLNIEYEDKYSFLIERLLHPEIEVCESIEELLKIWQDLALYEVLSYFAHQMNDVGYSPVIGEITTATFNKLLEVFSVGQIYNIIFRAVANSTRAYQSGDYTKKHAMNMVVASCRNQGEKAVAEEWDLKPYNRIKQLPESELSRLLFTTIFKKPNQGFYFPPTLESLEVLVES